MHRVSTIILIIIFSFITVSAGENLIRLSPEEFGRSTKFIKNIDIAGANKDIFYDIVLSDKEMSILNAEGIIFSRLEQKTDITGYISLSDMYTEVESLHIKYPALTSIDTLATTSQYGFPLVALKIHGSDPDNYTGGKAFLLMGNHHAREWQTVTLPLFFADSILSAYSSDTNTKNLIDSVFIVIIPSVNPDGYYYSHDLANNYWRKNRAFRNGLYGVDLNRNYPGGTNSILESDWGYTGADAATHSPGDDLYCGPYYGSERETQAVMNLVNEYNLLFPFLFTPTERKYCGHGDQ